MKTQRFAIVLTLLNLALLIFLLVENRRAEAKADAQNVAPVLRGRAFELVDDQGKVRADLKVYPADPKVKMPDGTTGYPETVMLRLYTSKGGPHVKLATMEDGSGLVLGGDSNPTYVQILSRGANPFLKLVNKEGREQVIKP
jgi:hypothetical protein